MSQLTKQALANSLKKLMATRSLEKITVKNLVEDCGVNRQTFYYHFQDIYDLLGWIYKTEAMGSISNYKTYETWQTGFLKIFQYVDENKAFCINTLNSLGKDHLVDFLHSEVFALLLGVINEVSKNSNVSYKSKKFIANFYTYAFIGILVSWVKEGMKDSPKDIIENIEILICGDIEKAMKKLG